MEPTSGDGSENLNDIIIKKELNIEFDEYQNILTDGLQIDPKQEVCEDLKEDISNCEELKRPTNRKNIKRENETQCAYPETSKKQKLLHQHSEDETAIIKNELEIGFQNNSTEYGQLTTDGFSAFSVDYSLVPIGDQQIPCISWSSQSYCLLRALRFIFISELSEDIVNCAYIHPISVSDLQNKFLIHIDIKLSDTTFTSEDEFISIEESHLYYNFLKTCSSKLSNNTKNSNTCGLIKMMDETVIPYVVRYNSKLLPLCYFKNRRDLQLDLNKLKIETVSGWELSYLKFCCIVRGTASGELFESDACDVASLSNIVECFPLSIKFEDYWPRSDSEFELLAPSQDISISNPQFHYLMEGISTSIGIPKNMNGKNNAQFKSTKMASSDDEYVPHSEVDSVADSDVDSDVHFNDYSSEHSEIDNEVEADIDEFYQAKMDPPGDEYKTVNKNYECTDDGNSESERIPPNQNNLCSQQYDNWTKTQSIIPDFGFDSVSSGIQKDIGDTPIDIFRSIWTGDVKKLLIESTNAYGKKLSNSSLPKAKYCRLTKFNEMNDMELENFFGLCLLGGQLGFPTLRKLFSRDPLYYHPVFSYVMSGRRFENILSCLNCSTTNNDRMSKISPLVDIIVSNFQKIYSPSEEIYLDEPFLLHQGRLWLQRHTKGKKASYGVKFYELCSPNGYIHNLEIYRGRLFNNEPRGTRIDAGVLRLMNPFLHKGHHIFMDSYYNNISLCTELLEKRTHITGILHADRRGNPGEITNKRIKKGEHIWLRKNNIYISKWHDTREVLSITTKHHPRLVRKINKYGIVKVKPIEVVEYTKFMDGVDRADQLISFYSCPRKTIRWYKKIIFHVLDTTVFNSWILYRIKMKKAVSFVQFREILIKSLLGIAHLANGKDLTTTRPSVVNSNNTISLQLENHVLEKIPVPINYRRKSYFLRCRWCSKENKRTNTSWRCPICPNKPPLCLGNCFKYFHAA